MLSACTSGSRVRARTLVGRFGTCSRLATTGRRSVPLMRSSASASPFYFQFPLVAVVHFVCFLCFDPPPPSFSCFFFFFSLAMLSCTLTVQYKDLVMLH